MGNLSFPAAGCGFGRGMREHVATKLSLLMQLFIWGDGSSDICVPVSKEYL